MATSNSPQANNQDKQSSASNRGQGVSDMYDDEKDENQEQESEGTRTTGDKAVDLGNDLSQDYRDANTISDGALDDHVKEGVNAVKDKYFPKKQSGEEPEDQAEQSDEKGEDSTNNLEQDGQKDTQAQDEGQKETDQEQPEGSEQPEQSSTQNINQNQTQGNAGEQASSAPGKAADVGENAGNVGQKAADATGKVADTGSKAADAGSHAASAAAEGAQIAAEGAEVAAEGGALAAEAGTGAATGGVAIAVAEGAKAAARAGKALYNLYKKGLQLKEKLEASQRLMAKYWKCGCCLFIPLLILIGLGYYLYSNVLHLDTLSKIGKSIVSLFRRNNSSGNLTFTDPASMTAIENGDISETVGRIMTFISSGNKHVTINFVGTSPITGETNEPYQFDVITYDTIKCALGTEKLTPIKINLSPTYNWSSAVVSGKENARCAVGYYPGLESGTASSYSSYGPGEFALKDIAINGLLARNQKTAELIDEVARENAKNVAEAENVPLFKLTLSSEVYSIISSEVIKSLTANFPDKSPSEIIEQQPQAAGVHFDFGI